ncbi:MAG: HAD family acid phosphatase [Psychrobium sp.]
MNRVISGVLAASLCLATVGHLHANPTNNKSATSKKLGLSTGVKWTQQSKEFPLLTSYLYQQATQNLKTQVLPTTPWLVIMDIDETLLNNSDYNKRLDLTGGSYTGESWQAWVHEKNATAIPGAIEFVKTVIELGGQLALVTNRNHIDDSYTWQNLLSVGFPIDRKTTCLTGKRPQDKKAIDNINIINDKDLRRQEFISGQASQCWGQDKQLKSLWNRDFSLVYQVGDNIEDIAKTTQKNADVQQLLLRQGKDILILPNAMYGSWGH